MDDPDYPRLKAFVAALPSTVDGCRALLDDANRLLVHFQLWNDLEAYNRVLDSTYFIRYRILKMLQCEDEDALYYIEQFEDTYPEFVYHHSAIPECRPSASPFDDVSTDSCDSAVSFFADGSDFDDVCSDILSDRLRCISEEDTPDASERVHVVSSEDIVNCDSKEDTPVASERVHVVLSEDDVNDDDLDQLPTTDLINTQPDIDDPVGKKKKRRRRKRRNPPRTQLNETPPDDPDVIIIGPSDSAATVRLKRARVKQQCRVIFQCSGISRHSDGTTMCVCPTLATVREFADCDVVVRCSGDHDYGPSGHRCVADVLQTLKLCSNLIGVTSPKRKDWQGLSWIDQKIRNCV